MSVPFNKQLPKRIPKIPFKKLLDKHLKRNFANRADFKESLSQAKKLELDTLEPRILLNADIMALNLADPDGDIRNNDLLIRLFDETEEVNGQSIQKARIQILDNEGGTVLAFGDLADISAVQLTGSLGDDSFRIESSTLDQSASLSIILDGSEGTNNIIFDTQRDTSWTIDGENQGTASDGVIQVTFNDIQNLAGAADNNDTFVLNEEGTLEGILDGGDAGYDTLIANKAASSVAYQATGETSGILSLDDETIQFTGLEPVSIEPVDVASISIQLDADSYDSYTAVLEADSTGVHDLVLRPHTDYSGAFESLEFNVPTSALTITSPTDHVKLEINAFNTSVSNADISALTITVNTEEIVLGESASLGSLGGELAKVELKAENNLAIISDANTSLSTLTTNFSTADTVRKSGVTVDGKIYATGDVLLSALSSVTANIAKINGNVVYAFDSAARLANVEAGISVGSAAVISAGAAVKIKADTSIDIEVEGEAAVAKMSATAKSRSSVTVAGGAIISYGATSSPDTGIDATTTSVIIAKDVTDIDIKLGPENAETGIGTVIDDGVFSAASLLDLTVDRETKVDIGTAAQIGTDTSGKLYVQANNSGDVQIQVRASFVGSAKLETTDKSDVIINGAILKGESADILAYNSSNYSAVAKIVSTSVTGTTSVTITSADIQMSGAIVILAQDTSEIKSVSDNLYLIGSGLTGIDITYTYAVNDVAKDVTARIVGGVVKSTLLGNVSLTANNAQTILSKAKARSLVEGGTTSPNLLANGISLGSNFATNLISGSVISEITTGADVQTTAGEVLVLATNDLVVSADTRGGADQIGGGGGAVGISLAFNLIGYTLDLTGFLAVASESIIGAAFNDSKANFATLARISGSNVVAGGLVSVRAENRSMINASASVIAKSESNSNFWYRNSADLSKKYASSFGFSLLLSSSKVNSSTIAIIENAQGTYKVASTGAGTVDTAAGTGSVVVKAEDNSTVFAANKVVASSINYSDKALTAIGKKIGQLTPAKYTTDGGNLYHATYRTDGAAVTKIDDSTDVTNTVTLTEGSTVLLSGGYTSPTSGSTPQLSTGEAGAVYRWVGTDGSNIDLKTEDYTDTKRWQDTSSRRDSDQDGFLADLFDNPRDDANRLYKVKFGDRVGTTWNFASTNGGGGEPNKVYRYLGGTEVDLDFSSVDFTDTDYWQPVLETEIVPGGLSTDKSNSVGVGAMFARNEMETTTEATISNSVVEGVGEVLVSASQNAKLYSEGDMGVESDGGKDWVKNPREKGAAGRSVAFGGFIVANGLRGGAKAEIGTNSSVSSSADNVTVTAVNAATLNAENKAAIGSARSAFGAFVAFNTIGYEFTNYGVATLDALVGTTNSTPDPSDAEAVISSSSVSGYGGVSVTADNAVVLNALFNSDATSKAEAFAGASAEAAQGFLASNMVAGEARASIVNVSSPLIAAAGDVSVAARDRMVLNSRSVMKTSADSQNDLGTALLNKGFGLINKLANQIQDSYQYTTKSGNQNIDFGERVLIASDFGDEAAANSGDQTEIAKVAMRGKVYKYLGQEMVRDLGQQSLFATNTRDLWLEQNETNLIDDSIANMAIKGMQLEGGSGGAYSVIIARNIARGGASAFIQQSEVQADGSISVTAREQATLTALENSSLDGELTVGGTLTTNQLNSKATAFVLASTLNSHRGDIRVKAFNLAVLSAVAKTDMIATTDGANSSNGNNDSKARLASGIIAYNTVGYENTNLAFQLPEALIGSGYLAEASPVGAEAYIENSSVNARNGNIEVIAESAEQIADDLAQHDSAITAEGLNDVAETEQGTIDVTEDAAFIGKLATAFTAAGISYEAANDAGQAYDLPLHVEVLEDLKLWLVTDKSGQKLQIKADAATGILSVHRVNLIDAVVSNVGKSEATNDRALFDGLLAQSRSGSSSSTENMFGFGSETLSDGTKSEKKLGGAKQLKYGTSGWGVGVVLATNRIASETQAWISQKTVQTADYDNSDFVTILERGTTVAKGDKVYTYVGAPKNETVIHHYSSEVRIDDVGIGQKIKLAQDWGGFTADQIIVYNGKQLATDLAQYDATLTAANFDDAAVATDAEIEPNDATEDQAFITKLANAFDAASISYQKVDSENIALTTPLSVEIVNSLAQWQVTDTLGQKWLITLDDGTSLLGVEQANVMDVVLSDPDAPSPSAADFSLVVGTTISLANVDTDPDWLDVTDNTSSAVAGQSITVKAVDTAYLHSKIDLEVSTVVENNMDAFKRVGAQLTQVNVDYTTKSGSKELAIGDYVYIASDSLVGTEKGQTYKYIGAEDSNGERVAAETATDLGALISADLSGDTSVWERVLDSAGLDAVFSNWGNLAPSNSSSVGISLATNEVDAAVSASVMDTTLTSQVAHTVNTEADTLLLKQNDRISLNTAIGDFSAGDILVYNGADLNSASAASTLLANGSDFDVQTPSAADAITVEALADAKLISTLTSDVSSSGGSTWGSGTDLAVAMTIATNMVRSNANVTLTRSVLDNADGDVFIRAENSSVLLAKTDAIGSSGNQSIVLNGAFNAIGWDTSNWLFNLAETLTGNSVGRDTDVSGAQVALLDTSIVAGGNVSALALSVQRIEATFINASKSTAKALVGASGLAIGVVFSTNKLATETDVTIASTDGTHSIGATNGTVTIKADEESRIKSITSFINSQETVNDGGIAVINELDNGFRRADWVAQPSATGAQMIALEFGDTVRVPDDYRTDDTYASADGVYRYLGDDLTDLTQVDLNNTDFLDKGLWQKETLALQSLGNLTTSKSRSIGFAFSSNDLRSNVSALLKNTDVTAGGAVMVEANAKTELDAQMNAAVSSSGGSFTGRGVSTAIGGIIVTNATTGTVSSSVIDADIRTSGAISITATNTSALKADNAAETSSGDTAGSIALAFNSVGWLPIDIISSLSQTFISPTYSAYGNGLRPMNAEAWFINSNALSEGGVTAASFSVTALNKAQLIANNNNDTQSNASALKGAEGTAGALTLATNKLAGSAIAKVGTAHYSLIDGVNIGSFATVEATPKDMHWLTAGDRVENSLGAIYEYSGEGGFVDLASTDFLTGPWTLSTGSAPEVIVAAVGDVVVKATDEATFSSSNEFKAKSKTVNQFAYDLIYAFASEQINAHDYTTESGNRTGVKIGENVYISDNVSSDDFSSGEVYQFINFKYTTLETNKTVKKDEIVLVGISYNPSGYDSAIAENAVAGAGQRYQYIGDADINNADLSNIDYANSAEWQLVWDYAEIDFGAEDYADTTRWSKMNELSSAYDFLSNSSASGAVEAGSVVEIVAGYTAQDNSNLAGYNSPAAVGEQYKYIGDVVESPIDFAAIDYSNSSDWELVTSNDPFSSISNIPFVNLNVTSSLSKAAGLLFSFNHVLSDAVSVIANADVDSSAGEIQVSSISKADFDATIVGSVSSDGGSFFTGSNQAADPSKPNTKPSVATIGAYSATVASNYANSSAITYVLNSKLTTLDSAGHIKVDALTETAFLSDIKLDTKVEGAGNSTSIGVTLAFNAIGSEMQDIFTSTVGALFGVLLSDPQPNAAIASVEGSQISSGGTLDVLATNKNVLDSKISNASFTTSISLMKSNAVSFAPIVALNRGTSVTSAKIENSSASAVGGMTVSAIDQSTIASTNTASTVSLSVGAQKVKSFSPAIAMARNVLRNDASAQILGTGLTTQTIGSDTSITVLAQRKGSISAVVSAVSASVALGTGATTSVSVGGAIAVNTLLGTSKALIHNVKLEAPSVTVRAITETAISAKVVAGAVAASLGTQSSKSIAIGISVADNFIGWDGPASVPAGAIESDQEVTSLLKSQVVVVADGALAGRVYKYIGENQSQTVDLSIEDFTDETLWEEQGLQVDAQETSAIISNSETKIDTIARPAIAVDALNTSNISSVVLAGAVSVAAGRTSQNAGGAGTFTRNKIASDVKAYIKGKSLGSGSIQAAAITVRAFDDSTISALAGGASASLGLGAKGATTIALGITIALNDVSNDVQAWVEDATIDASSLTVGAYTRGAKTFAINDADLTATKLTEASIEVSDLASWLAGRSTLEAGASATIDKLKSEINAALNVADSGYRQLEASDAIRLVQTGVDTWMAIVDNGRSFEIKAGENGDLNVQMVTIRSASFAASVSAALSGNKSRSFSGAGAYAENTINQATEAVIKAQSSVTTSGDVTVEASSQAGIAASILSASLSIGVGRDGGALSVGIAIAKNTIGSTLTGSRVKAAIETSKAASSAGKISVLASNLQAIRAETFAAAVAIAGGKRGVALSGTGAENTNIIATQTIASIEGKLSDSNGVSGQSVEVKAVNNSSVSSLTAAAAVSAAIGSKAVSLAIGVGLASNVLTGTTSATISKNAEVTANATDVTVKAEDTSNISAIAAAASVSVAFGQKGFALSGAGAQATNRINSSTLAAIIGRSTDPVDTASTRSVVGAQGNVSVEAKASGSITSTIVAGSVAVGAGSTGVGASIGVALANNYIGVSQIADSALARQFDDINNADDYILSETLVDGLNPDDGASQRATRVKILSGVRAGHIYEYIGAAVDESSNTLGEPGAKSQSFGKIDLRQQDYADTALWKLVNQGTSGSSVEAKIDQSDVTANDLVNVDATNTQSIRANTLAGSVALALGKIGVALSGAGAAANNVIMTDVSAHISSGSTVGAYKISVNADDIATINSVVLAASVAAAFGKIGVAISIGVSIATNEIANDVKAYVDNATLTAGETTSVLSATDAGIFITASNPELPLTSAMGPAVSRSLNISSAQLDLAVKENYVDENGSGSGDEYTALEQLVVKNILADLKIQLSPFATFVGDLRITTLESATYGGDDRESKGTGWLIVDEAGNSWELIEKAGLFQLSESTINAISMAASVAIAAGKGALAVAGAGAVSTNAIRGTIQAFAENSTLSTPTVGNVTIDARSSSVISSAVLAVSAAVGLGAAGVGVGVGVSIAKNYIGYDINGTKQAGSGVVSAFIRSSTVETVGNLHVEANGLQSIKSVVFAGAVALGAGKLGIGAAGSGVDAINKIAGTISAYIDGSSATNKVISADAITVKATDNSSIRAVGGAAAVAAGFGMTGVAISVGVSLAENTIETAVNAEILNMKGADSRVTATQDINVLAHNQAVINATSAAAALAISAGVFALSLSGAGAFAENIISSSATARVVDSRISSSVTGTTGSGNGAANLKVESTSSAEIRALIVSAAAAISVGKVGIAVGVGLSDAKNTIGSSGLGGVFASIEGSDIHTSNDVSVIARIQKAKIKAEVISVAAAIAAGFVAGAVSVAGSDALNVLSYSAQSFIKGSTVATSGNVNVEAYDNSEIDSFVGAAAIAASFGAFGGAVSIAVSEADNQIGNTISAYIEDSSVTANDVSVLADDSSKVYSASLAASLAASISIGFSIAGSGAETETILTNTVSAYLQGTGLNDTMSLTGNLKVNAISKPDFYTETGAISVSLGLAALADSGGSNIMTVNPDVSAYVKGYQTVTAQDVEILAKAQLALKGVAEGMSISTGLSMGSNSTTINVGSTIAASAGGANNQFHVRKLDILSETGALHAGRHAVEAIGNSSAGGLLLGVTSTSATVGNTESVVSQLVNGTKIGTADRYSGQISVSSSSNVDQRAESNAAAGGLIGAGEARATANSNTTSNALIGDVTVYAGQMSVDAGGNSYSNATTEAGSGGLVAASGARPLVDMDANVKAQVSDGADINIHEQQYYEDLYAAAYDALSAGYGDEFDQRTDDQIIDLIKLSYTDAEFNALSQSDIDTKLAAAKTAEERVGFIARQYLELGQTKDQYIAAQITETLKTGANEVTGTFSINAQHTARPDAYVITESYGLIGGSGADSDINVNSTVTAKIGTGTNVGAMVKADHISILASNQVDKQAPADLNIDGNAGGLVAGASASSDTVLTLNTLVDIGANSLIETVFESKSAALTEPGSVVIKALNSITFRDEVALFTGGALSGAGAFTTLSSTVLVAKINVGLDAQVRSKGEIIMETNAAGDVYLQSYSETNGLGSVALGDAVINLRPTSEINVYGTVRALKDIYLTAGTDRYQDLGSSTFKARVDNVAGSLIPISDLETQIRWIMTNNVVIHDQGHLQGANNISLFANDIAFGNLDAKAKGTNWMSAIGDAIDAIADSGSVEFGPGSGVALGVGQVINNGIIETGIARQKRIVIEGVKETGKSTFNKYIAQALDSDGDIKGEITFTKTDVGGVPQFVKATTDFADIPTDVRAEQPETDFDLDLVFEVVTSNLFSQYEAAVQNRARYETAGNDDLLAFYNTEIKRLGEEMLDKGEAIEQKDSNGNKIYENGNVVITPRPAQVPILKVKPITAAAGFVTVFSDHLLGDGTFKSPKDVTLEIISKTDAYLEIEGAVIPDITGGVIFNDLDVSEQLVNAEANRKIGLLNDKAIQNDNARLTKIEGGSVSGVNVSVSPISIAGQTLDLKLSDETYGQRSTLPKILIEVGYDAVGQLLQQQRLVYDVSTDADGNEVRTIQNNSDGSPALEDIPGVSETVTTWPNIIISGDVLNLQGNVVIDNNSSVSVDSAGITAIATIRDATFRRHSR